jgi:hypothetical protein
MILQYIIIGIVVALLIGAMFPRPIALYIGLASLFMGIIFPIGIWCYAEYFVAGDNSAEGMLGTICVILFAPAGFVITVVALLKSN